jgi:hypothetical protein
VVPAALQSLGLTAFLRGIDDRLAAGHKNKFPNLYHNMVKICCYDLT